jgi:glutamine amidotransferase
VIALIDYGAGNLGSVARAFAAIGHPVDITGDPRAIIRADRIVLPGVGAFASCMRNLAERGLVESILTHLAAGRPFLGLCLGLQLLLEESEEKAAGQANPRGLGIFPGVARVLPGPGKVPQIGWNTLHVRPGYPVLGPADGRFVYFVHSYYVDPSDRSLVAAETTYDLTFPAVLGRDNILACQFHPEKSGAVGLGILRRFCEAF